MVRSLNGSKRLWGLVLFSLWLASCSTAPVKKEMRADYDFVSQAVFEVAKNSPDLDLKEIGRQGADRHNYPIWLLSMTNAEPHAPRILMVAGLNGQESLGVQAIMERLGDMASQISMPQANIDYIPVLNPGGKKPVIEILKKLLAVNHYDLIIVHREKADAIGFSLTQYAGVRDDADFVISIFRDRGHVIQTYLSDQDQNSGISLINGVIIPSSNPSEKEKKADILFTMADQVEKTTGVYVINVPRTENRATGLFMFHLADDILIQLAAGK